MAMPIGSLIAKFRDEFEAEIEENRNERERKLAEEFAAAEVEIEGISAGGMPNRVKCLHVLAAHALACGPGVNPLGDEVVAALGTWWATNPCSVSPEDEAT